MDRETYLVNEIQPLIYSFDNIGPKGTIRKLIAYQPTGIPDEYNLALLDETPAGFSDLSVSANGDMERVLATVIQTTNLFFEQHSNAIIIFTGSDAARTRLYRAVINKYIDKLSETFDVFGVGNGDYEKFVRNKPYELFIIRLRHEN